MFFFFLPLFSFYTILLYDSNFVYSAFSVTWKVSHHYYLDMIFVQQPRGHDFNSLLKPWPHFNIGNEKVRIVGLLGMTLKTKVLAVLWQVFQTSDSRQC
jgi:hypothetical protein